MSGTELAHRAIGLGARYAMSGTDFPVVLCAYAHATRCAVLRQLLLLPAEGEAGSVRPGGRPA
eukprot:3831164-Rhodomonas_salina.1